VTLERLRLEEIANEKLERMGGVRLTLTNCTTFDDMFILIYCY
jgi:hypothetical protein